MQFGPARSASCSISSYFASSCSDCSNYSSTRLFVHLQEVSSSYSLGQCQHWEHITSCQGCSLGTEISLISSKLARTLDANLVPYHLQVDGIGPTPIDCKYVTTVEISSVNPNEHKPIPVSCHVVDNSLFVNTGADANELRWQMTERNLKP